MQNITDGQVDRENGSLIRSGPNVQGKPQNVGDTFRNAEAKPKCTMPFAGVLDLKELLEYCVTMLGRDADAGVADFQAHVVAYPAAADKNAATLGIADRICHEVANDSFQQSAVGNHGITGLHDAKTKSLFARLVTEFDVHAFEERGKLERCDAGFDLPCVQVDRY